MDFGGFWIKYLGECFLFNFGIFYGGYWFWIGEGDNLIVYCFGVYFK